ncbi:MAG: hypothetical protein Q9192_002091 [Flavoplaca navasiana]
MDTSTGQTPANTNAFDLNRAIADLQQIAEARPQSDPAMTITIRRTDLILAKIEKHIISLEEAYVKRHEEIQSLKDDQLAKASEAEEAVKEAEAKFHEAETRLDEAKTFAGQWHAKNEELAQRLDKANDYAERLRQREREQTKAEQELKDGQRMLKEEQARLQERLAKDQLELGKAQERFREDQTRLKAERGRLDDERKELGKAQERLTAQKYSGEKTLRDNSGALEAKRGEFEKSQEAHDLKVARFEEEWRNREEALRDREAAVQKRESGLADRETNAAATERAANVQLQALKHQEDAITEQNRAGIDEITQLISNLQSPSEQDGKVERELRETKTALESLSSAITQLSKDNFPAIEEAVTKLEQNSDLGFDLATEKLDKALSELQRVSSNVQECKTSIDEQAEDFGLTVNRSFEDGAKTLTGNLKEIDRKLDEISSNLMVTSDQVLAIPDSIREGRQENDYENLVEYFTTVLGALDVLKKDVADVRQRQTVRQEKRMSETSLPDSEARKRRASNFQDMGLSPSSQRSQPSSRPESPLLTRSTTSRANQQSRLPVSTHTFDPPSTATADPNSAPTAATSVLATSPSSPARELLPEGSYMPVGENAGVWQQILLKGEWTENHRRQLLTYLEETGKKADHRYRARYGLDHCARIDKEACLLSYCKRQPHKVPDPRFKCQQCGGANRELCLRVRFVAENPGEYDEASESMRWSLEIRPPRLY